MSEQKARTRPAVHGVLQVKAPEPGQPEWLRLAWLTSPGIATLHRLRDEAKRYDDPFAFVELALRELRIQLDLPAFEEDHIPASGAVIVTANHPYGGLDGLTAIA